ncbi:sigma-70 family RNA polymerase sigma factor [uncultured Vagococcus sp.]|uniref:sigma-70 family RNA polymerase sigma factor n=1 Tax=uncultured Vagococcus sp. TaxID=189676 RepID=UPI0028D2E06C|nr:sigma-70 family RNA polymerase sigma factor [uncultured Vagococcus sp.]
MFDEVNVNGFSEDAYSDMFKLEFERCRRIVFSLMRCYHLNGYDQDDWLQEARLVYWKSRENFDKSQGKSLLVFFSINFKHHVISLFRSQMAMKRNGGLDNVSLEELNERIGDRVIKGEVTQDFIDGIVLRDLLKDYSKRLSKFELIVWLNLLLGKSAEEISEVAELTVTQVNNAIDRVKRKIRVEM